MRHGIFLSTAATQNPVFIPFSFSSGRCLFNHARTQRRFVVPRRQWSSGVVTKTLAWGFGLKNIRLEKRYE